MVAPLTALECDLLEAVAHNPAEAAPILADYWIEHGEETRGAFVHLHHDAFADRIDLADTERDLAQHAAGWRNAAVANGFPASSLVLSNGFLQWPISVPEDGPLDGNPEIIRLSPRYIRETRRVSTNIACVVHDAEMLTPRTRTRVAIKSARHQESRELLAGERAVLSRLSHPNLPRLLGQCLRPDGLALVLAWNGIAVRSLIESASAHRRELGVAFALSVGVQLLDALDKLERNNIWHREVRTDHVLVAEDGTVTLIDFGQVNAPLSRLRIPRRDERYWFRYLSPEQCRGLHLDPRTDVFSAVGLISELVAGRHPFTADTAFPLLQQIIGEDMPLASQFPERIAFVLRMGAERNRDHRPTAKVLRDALVLAAKQTDIDIGPHVIAQTLCESGVPA